MMPDRARERWLLITLTRIIGAAGAIFGVVLVARAHLWPVKVLGGAIVLSALYMMAVVPAALAQRWKTPK